MKEPSDEQLVTTLVLGPLDAAEAQEQEQSDPDESYLPDGRFPCRDSVSEVSSLLAETLAPALVWGPLLRSTLILRAFQQHILISSPL